MKKLGNINALNLAKIYDKYETHIGDCADTPNVVAWAFNLNQQAEIIKNRFVTYIRSDDKMKDRIENVKNVTKKEKDEWTKFIKYF